MQQGVLYKQIGYYSIKIANSANVTNFQRHNIVVYNGG